MELSPFRTFLIVAAAAIGIIAGMEAPAKADTIICWVGALCDTDSQCGRCTCDGAGTKAGGTCKF
jgi:hypothetical protein